MAANIKFKCLDNNSNDLFKVDAETGISIYKTSNATSSTNGGSLTVLGGASFANDVYMGGSLNVENFTINNIITGVSSLQSGSFIASNNVLTPVNVTGLRFPNADVRSFNLQITVSLERSVGGNLYELFNVEGIQISSGWSLSQSSVGDESGIVFTITSSGQVQYTSSNVANWVATTIRFFSTKTSNTGSYTSLSNNTTGNYIIDSVILNNTNGAILGAENGALYSLGGAMFEKNIIIKSTSDAQGIGSGGSLSVLGGAAVTKSLVVGESISAATLVATTGLTTGTAKITNILNTNVTTGTLIATNGITVGNINFTGSLYQNGSPYVSSQWTETSGTLTYTSGTVSVSNFSATTGFTTGTARITNILNTNATTGTLIATNGITAGNINFTGSLYQNGALYQASSSQWSDFGSNIAFTKGNVGIGTTSPSYKLHVDGDVYATGDVTAFSDIRMKKDIMQIEGALDKVSQMRGVYYTNMHNDKRGIGVVAQEAESVIPEVVHNGSDGFKSVAYGNISGLLIEAINEMQKKLKELEKRF